MVTGDQEQGKELAMRVKQMKEEEQLLLVVYYLLLLSVRDSCCPSQYCHTLSPIKGAVDGRLGLQIGNMFLFTLSKFVFGDNWKYEPQFIFQSSPLLHTYITILQMHCSLYNIFMKKISTHFHSQFCYIYNKNQYLCIRHHIIPTHYTSISASNFEQPSTRRPEHRYRTKKSFHVRITTITMKVHLFYGTSQDKEQCLKTSPGTTEWM